MFFCALKKQKPEDKHYAEDKTQKLIVSNTLCCSNLQAPTGMMGNDQCESLRNNFKFH